MDPRDVTSALIVQWFRKENKVRYDFFCFPKPVCMCVREGGGSDSQAPEALFQSFVVVVQKWRHVFFTDFYMW